MRPPPPSVSRALASLQNNSVPTEPPRPAWAPPPAVWESDDSGPSQKWTKCTVCRPVSGVSHQRHVLKIHPCGSGRRALLTSVRLRDVPRCARAAPVCPSSVSGHVGRFHLLAVSLRSSFRFFWSHAVPRRCRVPREPPGCVTATAPSCVLVKWFLLCCVNLSSTKVHEVGSGVGVLLETGTRTWALPPVS